MTVSSVKVRPSCSMSVLRRSIPALTLVLAALTVLGAVPLVVSSASTAPFPKEESGASRPVVTGVADPSANLGMRPNSGPSPYWFNITSASRPPGMVFAAMAYDPPLNETVLFGGEHPSAHPWTNGYPTDLNATWAFQNGSWINITSSAGNAPSERLSPSLTYDARDGYLFMIGGDGNDSTNCTYQCKDAWVFDDGVWKNLPVPSTSPFQSINVSQTTYSWDTSVAAYDSTGGYILVQSSYYAWLALEGSSWTVQGSNWTDLNANQSTNATRTSPTFESPLLLDDPSAGGVLLFGGDLCADFYGNPACYPTNYTWLFSNGTWTNVTTNSSVAPPAFDQNSGEWLGAYDAASGGVLLTNQVSTWEWKNLEWVNVTPPPSVGASLPKYGGGVMAWDGSLNATLFFGGDWCVLSACQGNPYSNWTYEWTAQPPITHLAIQAYTNPVDPGVPTNFSHSAVGGVAPFNYSWNFGDGATSYALAPSHAYSTPGQYNVSLELTDSDGHSASAFSTVAVSNAPNLSPHISPDPTEVGVPTNFYAGAAGGGYNNGSGGSFTWSFGDSSPPTSGGSGNNSTGNTSQPSGQADEVHTYSAAGDYTAQVWWNDSGGGRVTKTLSLHVTAALGSPSVIASPADPYLGQLVNFTATSTGGTAPYRYAWQFGDGGTGGDLQSISHVYTTNGPFVAQVTIADAFGEVVTATENISTALNLSAFANVSFGAAPLAVGFGSHVSGGTPGYDFVWTFGDGGTSALAQPTHVYSTAGPYHVTVLVTDQAGNSASNSWNVTVATGGGPVTVKLAATAAEIPLGASDSIAATVTGGQGAYALRWTAVPAGCRESGLVELNCTPTTTGQFAVSLTVTDSQGLSGNATTAFAVGQEYGIHTGGPSQTAAGGIPASVAWGAVVAAALIAVAIGVVIGRRRGGGLPPPAGPDPRYAAYQSPQPGGVTPAPLGPVDPVDDLF
jgi:PKD repeat protein